jgi:hypothetical protein
MHRMNAEIAAQQITAPRAELEAARLDYRFVPGQELWGENAPREISVRDTLIQFVEHASLHLGHLEMTRDMAMKQAR